MLPRLDLFLEIAFLALPYRDFRRFGLRRKRPGCKPSLTLRPLALDGSGFPIPKHLDWDDLPEGEKFERLAPSRKRLTDTVKLVAYRAEPALATIVRKELSHADETHALLGDLFRSDADHSPDEAAGVLEVRILTVANPRSNRAVQHLLDHLNAAEFVYPGTPLRFTYPLTAHPEK